MKIGFYIASLLFAALLLMTILIATEPQYQSRHHGLFAIAIVFSIMVFSANVTVLLIYPFMKTGFLALLVKSMGLVSVVSILFLAFACPSHPLWEPSITSQLASPKP